MTDWIMAIAALATMVASVGVVAYFVPDLDLIIVTTIVSAMAGWDFWSNLRDKKNGD